MRDLHSLITPVESIAPAAHTASANGSSVDRAQTSNAFQSVAVVAYAGTITDGDHAITVEESDDDSTWTEVAAADLQGDLPTFSDSEAGEHTIGYFGRKRFVRAVTTVSGATSGGVYGALVVLGHAREIAQGS